VFSFREVPQIPQAPGDHRPEKMADIPKPAGCAYMYESIQALDYSTGGELRRTGNISWLHWLMVALISIVVNRQTRVSVTVEKIDARDVCLKRRKGPSPDALSTTADYGFNWMNTTCRYGWNKCVFSLGEKA